MKKFILLFLLIPSLCFAVEPIDFSKSIAMSPAILGGSGGVAAENPCAGYLVCQGFEGTGYDNGETWTEYIQADSSVNEDSTSTVLAGAQSLAVGVSAWGGGSGDGPRTYVDFTAQDNLYAYFLYQSTSVDAGGHIAKILDSEGNYLCSVNSNASGLQCQCSNDLTTAATLSNDTTIHVWLEYIKGTGTDGICRVAWSTDGNKPGGGDHYAAQTCTQTAQASKFMLGGGVNSGSITRTYDKIRLRATAIGSNPN